VPAGRRQDALHLLERIVQLLVVSLLLGAVLAAVLMAGSVLVHVIVAALPDLSMTLGR